MRRIDGKLYVGHGGGYPGYTTNTTIQLDSKVGVIVLTNSNDSNFGQISRQLMDPVDKAIAKAAAPGKDEGIDWIPSWERFAGRYRSRNGDRQALVMNEK